VTKKRTATKRQAWGRAGRLIQTTVAPSTFRFVVSEAAAEGISMSAYVRRVLMKLEKEQQHGG